MKEDSNLKESCDINDLTKAKDLSEAKELSKAEELTEMQKEFLELIESKLRKSEKETWLIKDPFQDAQLKSH